MSSIKYIKKGNNKMFAILDSNHIVVDCWMAKSLEEAQTDNPGKIVIEVTKENSTFILDEKYTKIDNL
jgi:hypothetical protein